MSRSAEPSSLQPGLLSASSVLEWRCREANVAMPGLPACAILTHQSFLLGRQWPWQRDRSLANLSSDVRLLSTPGKPVALVGCRGVGAPATAVAIEEMAVTGVKQIVALDVAASLDPRIQSGAIVVADSAVIGDGTSPHYSREPVTRPFEPLAQHLTSRLEARGFQVAHGTDWSTDAVYRETELGIAEARRARASIVDMETASVLTASAALGIEATAILVVADELFNGWHPPAGMSRVRGQLKRLLTELPDCFRS